MSSTSLAPPSAVLPALAAIFAPGGPSPPLDVYPHAIAFFHTAREWLAVVIAEADSRINARTTAEGAQADQPTRDALELARKQDKNGNGWELLVKAAHVRALLLARPAEHADATALIDVYFPASTKDANARGERALAQVFYSFVEKFVRDYRGPPDRLAVALASTAHPPEIVVRPDWGKLTKPISSWLTKTRRAWAELETLLPDSKPVRSVSPQKAKQARRSKIGGRSTRAMFEDDDSDSD